MTWMAYKEARGEPVRTIRAVLDVMNNRMSKLRLSGCQVLKQKGQYPYMRKGKVKKVIDKAFMELYNIALNMEPVLNSRYLYFNHVKHKFGKNTRRIGGLYFSQ